MNEKVWCTSLSGWTQISDPFDEFWYADGKPVEWEEMKQRAKQAGWEQHGASGEDGEFNVQWWSKSGSDEHYLELEDSFVTRTIAASDFPSALKLWCELQTATTLAALRMDIKIILEILEERPKG